MLPFTDQHTVWANTPQLLCKTQSSLQVTLKGTLFVVDIPAVLLPVAAVVLLLLVLLLLQWPHAPGGTRPHPHHQRIAAGQAAATMHSSALGTWLVAWRLCQGHGLVLLLP